MNEALKSWDDAKRAIIERGIVFKDARTGRPRAHPLVKVARDNMKACEQALRMALSTKRGKLKRRVPEGGGDA
ncbi:MAG: hypothetical protein V3T83_06445 [Acidobacteriota bacterium]